MTPDQAIQLGAAQASARLMVVEAAYGPDIASLYAAGMACNARDYMLSNKGPRATYDWFVQLSDQCVNDNLVSEKK